MRSLLDDMEREKVKEACKALNFQDIE